MIIEKICLRRGEALAEREVETFLLKMTAADMVVGNRRRCGWESQALILGGMAISGTRRYDSGCFSEASVKA
jgi:hypothetical protein